MNDALKFERIAGEGENSLYNLYIGNQRVGEALTKAELRERIEGVQNAENPADRKSRLCWHEWMYITDKDDSVLYQCIRCRRLKTVKFGEPIKEGYDFPTERSGEL